MDKQQMNLMLRQVGCVENGTKEACVKAREFLKTAIISEDKVEVRNSCVTTEEFIEAVKTLIAFSFSKEDSVPERWYCDNSCCKVSQDICKGEFNIKKDAINLCPYYVEES